MIACICGGLIESLIVALGCFLAALWGKYQNKRHCKKCCHKAQDCKNGD